MSRGKIPDEVVSKFLATSKCADEVPQDDCCDSEDSGSDGECDE